MPLTYVYTRLDVKLDSLAVTALFDEATATGLETLSDTLTTILTDTTLSELYTTAAVRDILEIHAYSTQDLEINQVLEDFQLLAALVRARIERTTSKHYGLLRAIHLELPNTLILEFAAYHPVPPKKPRVQLKEHRCRRSLFR